MRSSQTRPTTTRSQYSDLMDFFYVWLRRSLWDRTPEINVAFADSLGPKVEPRQTTTEN